MSTASPVTPAKHPHQAWVSSVAGNIATRALGLAATVIMARTLGPASRGVVAAALVWPATFISLGAIVGAGTAAFFAARKGLVGLQSCLIVAAAASVVLVPISATVNLMVFRGDGASALSYAQLYVVTIPVALIAHVYSGALLSRGRLEAYWSVRVVPGVLLLTSVALLRITHQMTVATYIVASVTATIATLALARILAGAIGLPRTIPTTELGEVLRYTAKVQSTNVPSRVHIHLDQLFLSVMLPLDQLGLYAVAASWSAAISIVGAGLTTVVVSRTVQANPATAGVLEAGVRRVRRAALLALVLGVATALAAPIGVPLLFGEMYRPAIGPAMILTAVAACATWKGLLHDFCRGIGRPLTGVVPELVGLAIAGPALFALVQSLGTNGAAIASLASYLVLLLLFLLELRRDLPTAALWPRSADVRDLARDVRSYAWYGVSRIRGAGASADR